LIFPNRGAACAVEFRTTDSRSFDGTAPLLARFYSMRSANSWREELAMEERPVLKPTEARQGVTGHNVRYVVTIGVILVVIAFIAIAIFAR
jgi:hypothetical protein